MSVLANAGYSVAMARTRAGGPAAFCGLSVDLVLLDYIPDVRILMFSGLQEVPANARHHADAFLQKGTIPHSGAG
jgi:hypothetical protein